MKKNGIDKRDGDEMRVGASDGAAMISAMPQQPLPMKLCRH